MSGTHSRFLCKSKIGRARIPRRDVSDRRRHDRSSWWEGVYGEGGCRFDSQHGGGGYGNEVFAFPVQFAHAWRCIPKFPSSMVRSTGTRGKSGTKRPTWTRTEIVPNIKARSHYTRRAPWRMETWTARIATTRGARCAESHNVSTGICNMHGDARRRTLRHVDIHLLRPPSVYHHRQFDEDIRRCNNRHDHKHNDSPERGVTDGGMTSSRATSCRPPDTRHHSPFSLPRITRRWR